MTLSESPGEHGQSQDCSPDVSDSYKFVLIRPGALGPEEPCVNTACVLAHHFLFSDLEEVFARALWFPKKTVPVLVEPHYHSQGAHGRGMGLEDSLLDVVWVLCLQISVFIPVCPGI